MSKKNTEFCKKIIQNKINNIYPQFKNKKSMRKLKNLFGISMLCVVLTSCNDIEIPPPLKPGMNDVRLYFDVRLDVGDQDLEVIRNDGSGHYTYSARVPRNTVIRNFRDVFELPGRNMVNRSEIRVSTFSPEGREQFSHRFIHPENPGLRSNSIDMQLYFDGNLQQLQNQRVDLLIHSNPYRRTDTGRQVNLVWDWSRNGSYFQNYRFPDHDPNSQILLMPEVALNLRARRLSLSNGDGGGEVHSVDGNRLGLEPNQPPCPLTAVREATLEPLVVVEAVLIEPNNGILKVYASEETYKNLVLR